MTEPEQPDPVSGLAEALARAREALDQIGDDEKYAQHRAALGHFANYVSLLRETNLSLSAATSAPAPTAPPQCYWLKLELPDGRWTVDYQPLDTPPSVGDTIELDSARAWRVLSLQLVKPKPAHEPLRRFLVCRPAA